MKPRLQLRFLISTTAALMLSLAALPVLATPGDIDTTFNGGTPVVLDPNPGGGTFAPEAAAMNPFNGDILWAGIGGTLSKEEGAITAYQPDGSLDPTVGSSGVITLTADQAGFTGGDLSWDAIAVDDQGRILAAGDVNDSGGTTVAMVLARFSPDGTLDTSFAGTGIVIASLNISAFGTGLSLTADGYILVTGFAINAVQTELPLTVWRFNPNGTADTAFGSNGHVQIAAVNNTYIKSCFPTLQPDGALIVGCQQTATGSWMLTRLKADGTVDTGFGSNGFVTGAMDWSLTGLALAPDGGFVISVEDSTAHLYMRRFLANGTVDTGFNGGNPLALGTVSGGGLWQTPVAVQPDGKILISENGSGGNSLEIGRLLADGTPDSGFGNIAPGLSSINFLNIGGYDYTPTAAALLLQGDGKIVVSGWADSTAGSSGVAAFITRVLSDTYDLTPTAPAFNDVTRAPLGQAIASNAITVSGVSIGSATSGFSLALVTQNGKYSTNGGGPFAGGFTGTNVAWAPAGSSLALEQMTPTSGGTDTTTSVVLGGFWATNNYEVPLGSPATASWTTTTDQPPVASDGTLSATTAKATIGTLSATNPSSGTLAFAIVTAPAHGTVTVTAATGAYIYTSTNGYTGADSFTWKVNDGVADSNAATISITVKAAPSSGGGGGFGPFALLGLLLLALVPWWLRRRGFRSTPTQLREATAMKPRLKLRFLVSTLAVLALGFLALPALAAPGDIDTTFNSGRPAVIDLNPVGTVQPFAAAINPLNGDILWAGYYQDPVGQGGTINVYKPDGSLDPAVGGGSGKIGLTPAQAGFTGGNLVFFAIAVDGQGGILAAGQVYDAGGTPADMVLARFKPDGTLDTSFGTAGTGIVLASLNTYALGSGLSLTADGHILVTGDAWNAGNTAYPLTVWRFNPDGTPDTGYGSNGHVQIAAINSTFLVWCFPALQPDGALIAGCIQTTAGPWKLTRLAPDGTVDTGFGTNGYLTGGSGLDLTGLALAPDGGFVISELNTSTSPHPLDMRRFLAAGTVDPSFNNGNPLLLGTVPVTMLVPVAVQPDGKILLSGDNGANGLLIGRFLADGTADTSFGTNGLSLIDFSNIGGNNYKPTNNTALLVQGDGKIVISGWADSTAGSGEAAFVTRVLSDTYDLTPTTPAFTAVAHAPLGQAVASNAVTVSGVSIGSATSGFSLALVTQNGKYSTSGSAPFAGGFTGTNIAWASAGSQLALEQMTPPTAGTDTTTTVILGGFWAANNYEVPLGSPATTSWTTTTVKKAPPSGGGGGFGALGLLALALLGFGAMFRKRRAS